MKYKMEENILEWKNIALKRKTSLPDGRFIDFAWVSVCAFFNWKVVIFSFCI